MGVEKCNNGEKLSRYCIFVLVLIATLTLMDGLDSTIVNIALKDIADDLKFNMSWTSWIVIAYSIPTVGLIVIFGKMFQIRAIKKILIGSIIVFGLSSLLCGLSKNIDFLVLCRFAQGTSGAVLLSATPILVVREMPDSKISLGMAVMAIASGISIAIGPTVGALLIEITSTWRSVFFFNLPICIFLVFFITFCFKDMDKNVHGGSMPNLVVCICYAFSTMTFIYVLTSLEDEVSNLPVYVAFLIASIVVGVYVYVRCYKGEERPLFHSTLVKNKEVILCTISFICTTITSSIILYLLPFYLRQALDVPAPEVGLLLGISSVLTIVCSIVAGKYCQMHGCKSLTIVAISFRILFAFIFMIILPEMGLIPVLIALVFMGVSFGFSGTAQPTRIVQHAIKSDKEDASSIMLTANYLGASLGVALCVIVLYITVPGAYGIPVDTFSTSMITDGVHYAAAFSVAVNTIALMCTLWVRNIIPNDNEEKKEEAVTQ